MPIAIEMFLAGVAYGVELLALEQVCSLMDQTPEWAEGLLL